MEKLINKNVHNQELIDSILIKLDGTKQKSKLGANAILAVSMAVKKLSSKIKKIPLYKNFLKRLKSEKLMNIYENFEKPLIKILAKMEINGIKVDDKFLKSIFNNSNRE